MGLRISEEWLRHLRFADNIVLLSKSEEQLQIMLQKLNPESKILGHRNKFE